MIRRIGGTEAFSSTDVSGLGIMPDAIFREAGGYAARVDGQPYNPLSRILGLLARRTKNPGRAFMII